MTPNTLIVVCGYQGDQHQIEMLMPHYLHHECDVLILSPEDSSIWFQAPENVKFGIGGRRAYIGQESLDRQAVHLKMALEQGTYEWFLFNDSDSFCLSPEIPEYLYDENVFWSNEVTDFRIPGGTWKNEDGTETTWPIDYHKGYPLIAMQPPYFMRRSILEKLVEAGRDFAIRADEITPFIDWGMVQTCVKAEVQHLPFHKGVSCETQTPLGKQLVANHVADGSVMIHAVKTPEAYQLLKDTYEHREIK